MDDEKKRSSGCGWVFRTFPLYLFLLAVAILVSTGVYSASSTRARKDVLSVLDILQIQESTSRDVADAMKYSLAALWALTSVTLAVAVVSMIIKYTDASKRDNFRSGARLEGRGCAGFCTARAILNTLVVLAILSCVLVVALIVLQAFIIAAFAAASVGTDEAQKLLNSGLQALSGVEGDAKQLLAAAKDQVQSVADSLRQVCDRTACDQVVPEAAAKLDSLQANIDTAFGQLGGLSFAGNCASGCLDLSLLWFLDTDGCLCDAAQLQQVGDVTDKAMDSAKRGVIAIAVAFIFWLLFLSKVSMNLKSMLKDAKWMREMARLRSQHVHAAARGELDTDGAQVGHQGVGQPVYGDHSAPYAPAYEQSAPFDYSYSQEVANKRDGVLQQTRV